MTNTLHVVGRRCLGKRQAHTYIYMYQVMRATRAVHTHGARPLIPPFLRPVTSIGITRNHQTRSGVYPPPEGCSADPGEKYTRR